MNLDPDFAPELTALVSAAIKAEASNLDLTLQHDEVVVNFRVHGDLKRHTILSAKQKAAVVTEIHCKLLGHEKICYDRCDNAVFHLPYDETLCVRVRLAMAPYPNGSMIFMRLLHINPTAATEEA